MDEEINVEELLLRISTAQRNINAALNNFQSTRDLGIKLNENFTNLKNANQLLGEKYAAHFENLQAANKKFLVDIKGKFENELSDLAEKQLAAPTQKIGESLQIVANLSKKTAELQNSFQTTFQKVSQEAETLQNTLKGLKWDEQLKNFEQNAAVFWKKLQLWIKEIDFAQQFAVIGEQIAAIKTVQKQINSLDFGQKADISQQINELKIHINELKTQLAGLDFATKTDFNQKTDALKVQISKLDFAKKADFVAEIADLKVQIGGLQQQISKLDFAKKADISQEVNSLKSQISGLEQQNNNLQTANNQILERIKLQNILLIVIFLIILVFKFVRFPNLVVL